MPKKYGRWNMLEVLSKEWALCRCACGTEKKVRISNLLRGLTRSCGCLRVECNSTHRLSYTPEYDVWIAMKQRCQNPNVKQYQDYGGRGITVCQRWVESFQAFIEDMGRRPNGAATLERQDNDCGYTPGNCIWATRAQQALNKRCASNTKLHPFEREEIRALYGTGEFSYRSLADVYGVSLSLVGGICAKVQKHGASQ